MLSFQYQTFQNGKIRKSYTKEIHNLLDQLISGTEQLLFSFMVPSTLSTTSNILEIQKLVSSGCSKLQRKLLFADSLAKLPYKIGGIREILTSMITLAADLQYKNERLDVQLIIKIRQMFAAEISRSLSLFLI